MRRGRGSIPRVATMSTEMESEELPLLYKVSKAAELLGISRTNVYYLMDEGRIRSVRIGKRRLIPRDALASFVRELEAAS